MLNWGVQPRIQFSFYFNSSLLSDDQLLEVLAWSARWWDLSLNVGFKCRTRRTVTFPQSCNLTFNLIMLQKLCFFWMWIRFRLLWKNCSHSILVLVPISAPYAYPLSPHWQVQIFSSVQPLRILYSGFILSWPTCFFYSRPINTMHLTWESDWWEWKELQKQSSRVSLPDWHLCFGALLSFGVTSGFLSKGYCKIRVLVLCGEYWMVEFNSWVSGDDHISITFFTLSFI